VRRILVHSRPYTFSPYAFGLAYSVCKTEVRARVSDRVSELYLHVPLDT